MDEELSQEISRLHDRVDKLTKFIQVMRFPFSKEEMDYFRDIFTFDDGRR